MRKLLLIITMLFAFVGVYGQNYSSPGVPAGTTTFTPTFRYKPATPDSLAQLWQSISGNKWYRLSTGMDVLVADARIFKGAGTTSNKFSLRDTVLRNNFIIRSDSTTVPALTLISGNLTDYVFKIKDLSGNSRVGASFSTLFAQELHYWKGQDYWAAVMTDSGTVAYRNRFLDGGYFMKFSSAAHNYITIDSTGIHATPSIDTAHMTAHPNDYVTAKWVSAHGGGGGNTLYTGDGTLTGNRAVNLLRHSLSFTTSVVGGSNTGLSIDTNSIVSQATGTGGTESAAVTVSNSGSSASVGMQRNYFGTSANISLPGLAGVGVGIHDGLGYGLFYDASSDYVNALADPSLNPLLILPKEANDLLYAPIGGGGSFLPLTFAGDNTVNIGTHAVAFNADDGAGNTSNILQDAASTDMNASDGSNFATMGTTGAIGQVFLGAGDAAGDNPTIEVNPTSILIQNQKFDSKVKSISLDTATNSGIVFRDDNLKGGRYFADYSTAQRLNQLSIPSVKTTIAIADSVKGTISSASGANPTASIGFTPVNGSAGTFTRSDGAAKADSSVIRSVANSYSLSGMQTKLNNYALTSALPVGANPTATAGSSAVNGSAATFMRSDAAPKVDSAVFRTVANSRTLAQTQTALNLKANLASPTFTGTVTIPSGGVFGTPTSLTLTNATGLPNAGLTNSSITVNGTSIALGASGTATAAAGTLTGTTLNSTVVTSSLTSIGTLASGSIPYSLVTGAPASLTAGRGILLPSTAIILDTTQNYTWGKGQTIQKNGIATTQADALYLQNNTASTSGVPVQYSPNLHFGARAWNTTATAADNWLDWRIAVGGASAATPTSFFNIDYSRSTTSTPSYSNLLNLTGTGNLSVTGALSATGLTTTSGGIVSTNAFIQLTKTSIGAAISTQNFVAQANTASTVGTPNQWSPGFLWNARVWNTTATAADNWAMWNAYVSTTSGTSPTSQWNLGYSLNTNGTATYSTLFNIASSGDVTTTGNLTIPVGKELKVTEGSGGFVGQTTLVSGTKAITITGVTTGSRAFVTLVSQAGTTTTSTAYEAVCTSNTLTISAVTNAGVNTINTLDTSTLNYFIIN